MDETFRMSTPAERPVLEAVVFDAGGTLVRIDFEWIAELLRRYGIAADAETVRRAEVNGRRRYDAAAGTKPNTPALGLHPALGSVGPTQAYFSGILEGAGCRHPVLEEAIVALFKRQIPPDFLWCRPMEGARQALDALEAMGMRACCVSNSDGRAEAILEHTGNRRGLEFVIDSQLVGIEKPDARIFAIALERMGVAADRAVYVGDIKSVDAAGARGAGMHLVLIDPYGDYADPDQLSVRRLDELPALLAERFTLVTSQRGSSAQS